jgi:hypothetical protein
MRSTIFILYLCFIYSTYAKNPWPYPAFFEPGSLSASLDPSQFEFIVTGQSNDILENGIQRIRQLIFPTILPVHPPYLITFSNDTSETD